MNRNFFQKSSSVTFAPLSLPNIRPKMNKILRAVTEKNKQTSSGPVTRGHNVIEMSNVKNELSTMGSFMKYGRFWPSLNLKISFMDDHIALQSSATDWYPFGPTSDQVSSKYFKWLPRKCPKTIQKGTKN